MATEPSSDDRYLSLIFHAISTVLGLSKDEIIHAVGTGTATFVEIGGDSLSAILISAECQHRGISIPAGVFLQTGPISEVVTSAASLARPLPAPLPTPPATPALQSDTNVIDNLNPAEPLKDADPLDTTSVSPQRLLSSQQFSFDNAERFLSAGDVLARIDTSEWTELQLLLLRETDQDQKLNMLTIHQTYTENWTPQELCTSWTGTILAEPIFQDLLCDMSVSLEEFMPQKIIENETEEEYQAQIYAAANATGPISQLTIVRSPLSSYPHATEPIQHTTVVWRVHHAFLDGYSARILNEKIARNLREGKASVTAGPSFKQMVRSLRVLREETKDATKHFWESKHDQLPSVTRELRLNTQSETTKITDVPGQESISIQLVREDLSAASARTGYTTTVYFAAAWALTLSKFMDADEVCFGMVLSGRDLPILGAFDVVGPMINILPLLLRVPSKEDGSSVDSFLRLAHDGIVDLVNVQHTVTADAFDKPMDSIMATQFECDEEHQSPTILSVDQNRPEMQSGVPMNLVIEEQSRLRIFYSTARYGKRDMENVAAVFRNAMNSLLEIGDGCRPVTSLLQRILPKEMDEMIREWSNCSSDETLDSSKGDDLVTLFENVVARQPNDPAVFYDGYHQMSYCKLDDAAAVVAQQLHWIQPNEAVCILADRSLNWIIAILGVLKAGGVYTPLDPTAPAGVQQSNFVRSGAQAVILPSCATQLRWAKTTQNDENDTSSTHCLLFAVDEILMAERASEGGCPTSYPRRRIARPDDLAYICFTSGSTGEPKAVQCTHKGLVAFQSDRVVRLGARRGVVIAQVMSPVFDGSIHEIFSALTHGAALRLASPKANESPFAHLHYSDSAILTPSVAKVLSPDEYPRLKNVYLVGEAVPQRLCDDWAPHRFLYNMYGPTEATCGATIKRLQANEPVTLGRPNTTSRVYILDRNQCLLPPGVVGELHLAGIQVSEGYINLPEMNKSRFLVDSIMPEACQMMYKTGDFAYWDGRTGEICLLGRKDRQIKLRGFRLDLDDLESRIAKAIPDCGGAAIIRREDHLIAAYHSTSVTGQALSERHVKELIGHVLPPYAMPRRILAQEHFPLTAAGKLDQKALEATLVTRLQSPASETVCSQDGTMSAAEKMVVDIVRDLLKLDSATLIDQKSNMTALGAHSIMQIQLANRLSSLLGRRVAVRTIIENPVIADLASALQISPAKENGPIETNPSLQPLDSTMELDMRTLGDTGVSPIEVEWFSKYRSKLGTSSFNVTHLSELDPSFGHHSRLVYAWDEVLARHSILRCRFREALGADGGVERTYASEPPNALYVENFDLRAAINAEFSLETEAPIRVLISRQHMLVCLSHIICDYTTLGLLFDEFAAAFASDAAANNSSLHTRRKYQDTNCWKVEVEQATADFWRSYLCGVKPPPYMNTPRTSFEGNSLMFRLSEGTMSRLDHLSRSLCLTPHQIALAVVSLVLQTESKTKQDLILGSPFLGREECDMETIGLFLQPIPIRIKRTTDKGQDKFREAPVASFLQSVQESAQLALSNGIQWASLMRILASSTDAGLQEAAAAQIPNHPLFDAMVTFHDLSTPRQPANPSVKISIPGIEPLLSWADGAKFGIMFEFSAVSSSCVTLRIEYDTSLFSGEDVRRFVARVNAGLNYVSYEPSLVTLGEVENKLSAVGIEGYGNNDGGMGTLHEVEFGTPLSALK